MRWETGNFPAQKSDRRNLQVLKGTKVHERRLSAAVDGLEVAGQNSIGRPKPDESLLPLA
jgi:hypothetical protein